MGEASVIFRDNQELSAADFNNQQDWAQAALDHVVLDAINDGKAYSGFAISKASETTISVASGRLYSSGAVYARDETVIIDLYNDLPITTQRQMAVVVYSQTIEEDIQPRDFLIDADTGQSQPQAVAMKSTRYCNVSTVRGVESSNPQYPSIDATLLLIGYVLLEPDGVVSFQQNLDTQVDNLGLVSDRTAQLEAWKSILSGAIDTLRTDLANLAKQFYNYVPLSDYLKLVDTVNELYKKVFRPGTFLWYGTDNFLDESLSAVGTTLDGAYAAFIDEGLRFPPGGETTTTLQLLDPLDPQVLVTSGFMIPKPSGSRVRMDCSFELLPWIEDRILQYTYMSNFPIRHLSRSRHRFRCGPQWTPCPPAQVWWYQAKLDPTYHILSFLEETWEALEWRYIAEHNEDHPDWPRHFWERNKYYWRDYVDVAWWSKVTTPHTHNGQHIGQPFLNSQDGWLTGVSVFLMKQYFQPLTLLISQCDENGAPDHTNQTIARVELDAAGVQTACGNPIYSGDIEYIERMLVYPNATQWWPIALKIPVYVYPCRIDIPPTFLKAGKRYCVHVISTYDHSFGVCTDYSAYQVCQAGIWHSGDNGLRAWPGTTKVLRMKLHYATWGRWASATNPGIQGGLRYEIGLQSLTLSGGINGIDVLAEHIVPPATDLSYQVKVDGVWRPFAEDPNNPSFANNPDTLEFRVVMTGTTDLMPGLSLDPSEVTLHKAAGNSLHHISTAITLGSAASAIKVIGKLHDFNESYHDCTCSLHYGATHNTTNTMTEENLDDGTVQRTWSFTGLNVTGNFQVEIDGTGDGVHPNFFLSQEIRYAIT